MLIVKEVNNPARRHRRKAAQNLPVEGLSLELNRDDDLAHETRFKPDLHPVPKLLGIASHIAKEPV